MSTMLSQKRAKHALDRVTAAKARSDTSADYARWCKRLPAMVLNNGLGQAMAFLRADAGIEQSKASYQLYGDISDWLKAQNIYALNDRQDLLRAICDGDRARYIRAQRESLELLGWMKRFSDGYIGKESGKRR